jgi:hypothetical protein
MLLWPFSVPILATDRAGTVLGGSPRWDSAEGLADVVDGMLHGCGTERPMLRPRSFFDAIDRDVSEGPLTIRRVPWGALLPCAPEQVTQGLIEVGLAKPVSGLAEFVGNHSLTGAREFAGTLLAEQ